MGRSRRHCLCKLVTSSLPLSTPSFAIWEVIAKFDCRKHRFYQTCRTKCRSEKGDPAASGPTRQKRQAFGVASTSHTKALYAHVHLLATKLLTSGTVSSVMLPSRLYFVCLSRSGGGSGDTFSEIGFCTWIMVSTGSRTMDGGPGSVSRVCLESSAFR